MTFYLLKNCLRVSSKSDDYDEIGEIFINKDQIVSIHEDGSSDGQNSILTMHNGTEIITSDNPRDLVKKFANSF